MKGGGGGGGGTIGGYSAKRRWRGFVIAVLGLVILSMLVPLVFLLGFHNGFHSSVTGFPSEQQTSSSETGQGGYDPPHLNHTRDHNQDQRGQSSHVNDLIRRLGPILPKEPVDNHSQEMLFQSGMNRTNYKGPLQVHQPRQRIGHPANHEVHNATLPKVVSIFFKISVNKSHFYLTVPGLLDASYILQKVNISSPAKVIPKAKLDESGILCELRFGSYCLWRREHREDMMDAMVKKLKDRLFVARAYYPSIAKLPVHEKLSRELRQNIQDFERVLSESTTDADLPFQIYEKLEKMEAAIAKSLSVPVDCNNVDKKFRQLVDLTEDEANFHTKQSAFLYQLAVQTMPKSLHCLSMRMTVEYFHSSPVDVEISMTEKYADPKLYHYVVFSQNILASSVVINSTVVHTEESERLVFHVLTDRENYYAMKLWFSRNTFKEATIRVLNLEDCKWESCNNYHSGLSLPEEFRVTFPIAHTLPKSYKIEYASLFSHSHYLLPEIFNDLDKIVVLDDDIVVQSDLSALWRINMGGKVNGAVESCTLRLGQLNNYLGRNSFDSNSCAWISGLNIIDLARWRKLNLTGKFRRLVHELKSGGGQNEAAASSASLLVFQDLVYPLDEKWVLSGLGHDYGLDVLAIRKSAVLHYNGNMKPWLELAIPRYRSFWMKFLNREDQFLGECNVF